MPSPDPHAARWAAVTPAAEPAPTADAARPARRASRRRPPNLGSRLGETLAALAALAIAGLLWWLGAYFTLACLRLLGAPLDALGAWQWLIPAAASAVELWWWPGRRRDGYQVATFTVVALLDLASTMYGLAGWAAGRTLPLGTGITVPTEGAGLIVPALAISLVLTFVPERLALWAIRELGAIWSDADGAD